MYAPVVHGFALAYVLTVKASTFLQKDADTKEQHGYGNDS